MIQSFKCRETETIWHGKYSKKFPIEIQKRALRKLRLLNASETLNDLRIPPSNHLEMLQGNRIGTYSIRINIKWRICFIWDDSNAVDVEIVDYH
jgi:proteic killer suppression protein